jgi:hypothetical protein
LEDFQDFTQMQERARIDAVNETTAEMVANGYALIMLSQTHKLLNWQIDVPAPDTTMSTRELPKAVADLRDTRTALKVVVSMDSIIYGVLNTYILPLLCALLGSAAYGLRSITEQTHSRTFRVSYATYARTILAVIVGFAVGLFSDFTANLRLQPLATAFLAGYAVEAFFIFIDNSLQAIHRRSQAT